MTHGFNVILAIIALGVLIIVHEWGHYMAAKLCKMRVDRFSIGFGPALYRRVSGETTFQVGAIPLGGYVQIAGLSPDDESISPNDPRSYINRPAWQRFVAIAAGPVVNYVFAVLVFFLINWWAGVPGTQVYKLVPGQPAQVGGLAVGDLFVRINGVAVNTPTEVRSHIGKSAGQPLTVQVRRSGELTSVVITPVRHSSGAYMVGIHMGESDQRERMGLIHAAKVAAIEPWHLTVNQLKGLALFLSGGFKPKLDDFESIIGITGRIANQMGAGLITGLEYVGKISALLGFFNLLPIPALDGGRLVFLGFEVFTRRRVNHRVEQIVHLIGLVILLGLMLLLAGNDIIKLFRR